MIAGFTEGAIPDYQMAAFLMAVCFQGMSEQETTAMTLAMARSADPNSAGSQFYFCLGPQHGLDSGYTVFGHTIEGAEVIGELRAGDVINSVRIERLDA